MANSPTIVAATLDSQALESAINNLVAKVNKSTKQMADDFTTQINRMNEALKTLGTAESGSKTDGGASRRIASMEKLQKTVDDTTASLQKQESELSALKAQQQALADAEQNSAQAALQQEASVTRLKDKLADLKNETKYAKSILDLLKSSSAEQLSPIAYTKNKAYDELAVANKLWDIMKRLKMDMNNGSLMTGNATEPIQKLAEYFKISREEAEKMVRTLRESSVVMAKYNMSFDTRFGLYELSMEKRSMLDKESPFYSQKTDWIIRQEKAIFEYEQALKRQEKAEQELTQATTQSSQASQQKAQVDSQVAAKEKEIAETRKQLTEATNNLENAQKQSDVSANASITRQKTQAENELTEATKKSTQAVKEKSLTLDQQDSAQKQAIQTTSKYSEQVRKLAAEIRATKEWQEKGHLIVGDVNYYDKERANVSKRDRQMLLSLEEQIVQAQQKESQEALIAADAKRQQTLAAKEAAQATRGISSIELGFSKDELNVSAGRLKQIESTKNLAQETQYLKQQVASLLEIEEREIKTANATSSSYAQLAQYLKHLQSAYQRLGADRIAKGEGTDIANEIQRTQRAMQKLQQTMSRPVSLSEAMKEPEKTLDDIAYKMQRLRAYRQGIDLTKPNAANEIKQVDEALARLQKDADKWMNKSKSMIEQNNALGRSWNYMKNRLAFYFTVGASTAFLKNLVEVRSQYEMNERALGILIDSAERGTQIFNELSQMALVSPYTLIELSAAAKQLTAYDIAAKDVVDTTRRLADMASAVGIPIERLTYALGQIKAYGYLNNRDARMFANAGIPLVKQLSEYYTELEGRMVSTADVYDRMKKKAIDYSDVMSVINKMTDEGGKFFGFQEKMADTLKVQIANLTLAWNNMLNDIGKSQQGILTAGIGGLKQLFLHWKELNKVLNDAAIIFGLVYTAHMLLTVAYGKGSSQILLQAVRTRTLTTVQINQLLTTNNLTKAQLKFMLSLTKTNQEAVKQAATLGILNKKELASVMSAGKLKTAWLGVGAAFSTVGKAIQALVASVAAAAPALLALTAVAAIVDLIQTVNDRNEAIKSLNESIVKNAEESAKSIKETLSSLNDIYENAGVKDATGLKVEEQEKAWEMLREQIELTSAASNKFIQTLLQEDKMGERVNKAKELLEHIQRVHEIMSTWHDDAIVVTDDLKILGIGADGLSEDLNDFQKYLNKAGGNIEELDEYSKGLGGAWRQILSYVYDFSDILSFTGAGTAHPLGWLKNIADETGLDFLSPDKAKLVDSYKEVMDEIEPLSKSIQEQILQDNITNLDEIKELVSKTISSIATERQWSDEKTLYARLLLEKQWGESQNAIFKNAVADNQTAWDAWMKYLTSRHKTEFSKMGAETISQEQWAQDGRKKLYEETFQKFKEYNSLAASMIEDSVHNLSQLQVHIKVFYDEQNTPSWIEQDFKKRVPSSNLNVKEYKTVSELIAGEQKALKDANEEIKRLRAAGVSELDKHFLDTRERAKQAEEALDAYNAEHEKATRSRRGGRGNKKDLVLEALKQEISLVDKLRSEYDKLVKSGATQADALETVRSAFGNTITLLNAKLGSSGLPTLDLEKIITGKDPHTALEHFKKTLDTLVSKGMLNLERSKELEAVIEKLTLSAKTYDLEKITKGLNNELDKLKDEYELAVELDANPELGDMFAQMFGIDTSKLPSTFGEALDKAQKVIDQKLKEMNINVPFNLMRGDINKFIESAGVSEESGVVKELISAQKTWQDMFKKNITDTEKVLDDYIKKYGDYSDKIAEIEANRLEQMKKLNEAYYTEEMRRTPEYLAKMRAIQQGADRQKQSAAFEEFKNSRYYTMMFENLDYISTKTISDMRDKLLELRDSMNELTPEQLKWVTQQYEKLEQKLIKRSPFKTLTKDVKEYFRTLKERKVAIEEFRDVQKQYNKQLQIVAALKERREQLKRNENVSKLVITSSETELGIQEEILAKLKEQLDAAQEKVDKYNLIKKLALEEAQAVANMVSSNLKGISELRDNLKETFGLELSNELDAVIDDLSKVGDGIGKVTSSAQSGDVFGIASGAVDIFTGIGDAIASIFGDGSARTKRINKEIERSVEVVRQLNMAYKELERTVAKTSGAEETAARRSEIANKKAQLAELERQMELEKSKRSKDRDDEKIKQYEETIQDLRHEIDDLTDDVVNNLLGTDAKNAAEAFVDTWVDAWRAGETTLDAIAGKMDEMIFNLIKKAATAKIVQNILKPLYEAVDKYTSEDSEGGVNLTTNELKALAALAASLGVDINEALTVFYGNLESLGGITREIDNGSKNLSALQQGIQSITEATAGALESYWNANTQQQYVQSGLLTEIRDTIAGFDLNVQLGVMTQILLQMQASYQVQMSIQNILSGALNPSGRAFSVELIS